MPSPTNLLLLFVSLLLSITISQIAMAEESSPKPTTAASSSPPETAVHIVYTEQPQNNEEPEAYHIRTLASVLGRFLSCSLSFCLFPWKIDHFSFVLMEFFVLICTVRTPRRRLWFTVTRMLLVDSPLSSLRSRSPRLQVRLFFLFFFHFSFFKK